MKKTVLLLFGFLFFGCSSKEGVKYYLPLSKCEQRTAAQKASVASVDSVSYLSGDRIWYKKDGIFLPYKNSYLAKTPKEYIEGELLNVGLDDRLSVVITDAYQSYEGEETSFMLSARVESEKYKKYKSFSVNKRGYGVGAQEAVKGFEGCVAELVAQIKSEFGGNSK